MGPKTLFYLLRPLYYSTLIDPLKDPFKGNPNLIVKAPILAPAVLDAAKAARECRTFSVRGSPWWRVARLFRVWGLGN